MTAGKVALSNGQATEVVVPDLAGVAAKLDRVRVRAEHEVACAYVHEAHRLVYAVQLHRGTTRSPLRCAGTGCMRPRSSPSGRRARPHRGRAAHPATRRVMDPNETLRLLRRAAAEWRMRELELPDERGLVYRLVELLETLDCWLMSGGSLPDDWGRQP